MTPDLRLTVGRERGFLVLVLCLLGLGWGLTQPLGKISVSTGHGPFVLIFWQLVICSLLLGTITLARGRGIVWRRDALIFAAIVAVIGTLVPNLSYYISIGRLPAGIMAILISAVPMLSFPMALALGMDRFSPARLAGLALGLAGVALIAAPGAGLYAAGLLAFIPLALIGPLFYAMEANFVARQGTAGMDAFQAMFMASLVGVVMCLPLTLISGQWINPLDGFGRAEGALVLSSLVHGLCYAGYVWLAGRAGAVFASQCSYLVTAAGVFWSMLILGERLAPLAWLALAVMLSGVALVQPRARPSSSAIKGAALGS
jgi:drug/metabolite transporter (DMT)-like permease